MPRTLAFLIGAFMMVLTGGSFAQTDLPTGNPDLTQDGTSQTTQDSNPDYEINPMVPYSDRALVVDKGTGEAKVDLFVGLNAGYEGEKFGIASGLASDHTSGLTFRAGVAKNFEMGISLQFLYTLEQGGTTRPGVRSDGTVGYNVDGTLNSPTGDAGPEGDGTMRIAGWGHVFGAESHSHLSPLYVYARYAFLSQVAIELGVIVPTEQVGGLNRVGLRLGIPFQWILSPGLLSVHVRPDLITTFAATGDSFEDVNKVVFHSYYVDAGLTLNLVDFFADVTVAFGGDIYPYDKVYLPLTFLVGYTVIPKLDLYAGFTLANLIPESGSAADARNLTTGFRVRW